MIGPGYARIMARYNAWQNDQVIQALAAVPPEVLTQDRRAFFGSILGTLNHLLWADMMWMWRLDNSAPKPLVSGANSTTLMPSGPAWSTGRSRMDGLIIRWTEGLQSADLKGDLSWVSGSVGQTERPVALCISHMFNHQTHHRGQVHAMLTAAGLKAPLSDLVFMPGDI